MPFLYSSDDLSEKDRFIARACQSFFNLLSSALSDELFGQQPFSASELSSFFSDIRYAQQEASRIALQEFLQSKDPDTPTFLHEGTHLRRKTRSIKEFHTPFGIITLKRSLYYDPKENAPAYAPLDQFWGMVEHNISPDLAELILLTSTDSTPKKVAQILEKGLSIPISKDFVYSTIQEEGRQIHEQVMETCQAEIANPEIPQSTEVVAVSFDGANIPLREEGKGRGRPHERPHLKEENQTESTRSCYKNAMVGAVSFYQPGSMIRFKTAEEEFYPIRLGGTYLATMPEEGYPTFKEQIERTCNYLEPQIEAMGIETKILLLDGGKPLWSYVNESGYFEDYDYKVLDYYHAMEHLSNLARALFGKKKEGSRRWYKKWASKIKRERGGVCKMLASALWHKGGGRYGKTREEEIEKEEGFFRRNQGLMNYAELVEKGYPIGSGPVEAACKTIVKSRMCRSGMRWNRESGQNVLTLRAIDQSGVWGKIWENYLETRWG